MVGKWMSCEEPESLDKKKKSGKNENNYFLHLIDDF